MQRKTKGGTDADGQEEETGIRSWAGVAISASFDKTEQTRRITEVSVLRVERC